VDEEIGDSAFKRGVSVLAEGVKSAEPVSAFEPADGELDDANEEVAPAPLPPVDGKLPAVPPDAGRLTQLGERWGLGSSLGRFVSAVAQA